MRVREKSRLIEGKEVAEMLMAKYFPHGQIVSREALLQALTEAYLQGGTDEYLAQVRAWNDEEVNSLVKARPAVDDEGLDR